MHRNVMSPMSVRRFGACVKNATIHHQVRRLSASRKWQQTASDRNREHEERLSVLQSEDYRLLQPVKANLHEYLATVEKARDSLERMPAALQPILPLRSVYSFASYRAIIAEAQALAQGLRDEKLPDLLAHLEDLELEDYPEPKDERETEFLARVKDMSPAERRALLDTVKEQVEATTNNLRQRVQNWTPEQEEAETEKMQARNPLPGPHSTEEQFANVISDATAKTTLGLGEEEEDVRQRKESKTSAPEKESSATTKPKSKTVGFDLNSLQAKLEASIKKFSKG